MQLVLDLHSHSGYSGAVGKMDLPFLAELMQLKGIDIFASADALHPAWFFHLQSLLYEKEQGLFALKSGHFKALFLLQSEIILTFPYLNSSRRKSYHLLLFFPSFDAILKTQKILENYGVKNTIGRPFIKFSSLKALSDFLFLLKDCDSEIECIPAHVMTADGIFGYKNPLYSLEEVFGDFATHIKIIETGLSADPLLLEMIPEFKNMSMISNSDAHSADLRRIGREYTVISLNKTLSYSNILTALRENKVLFTGEFSVLEGRYFLTGHRANRKGHDGQSCCFLPKDTPKNGICPICGKKLTIGVLQRVLDIAKKQGSHLNIAQKAKRDFVSMVPLVEVIALALQKGVKTKTVREYYVKIVKNIKAECYFWFLEEKEMLNSLMELKMPEDLIKAILDVKKGNFFFEPIGFDGEYGKLKLGKKIDLNKLVADKRL